jgi:very-short-patch-repair endonuclease
LTQSPPNPAPTQKDLTQQVNAWRRQLLDTSKRNRLISAKLNPQGGLLPLTHPTFPDLWEHTVIREKSLSFPPATQSPAKDHALTPLSGKTLENKLKRLDLAARTSLSEQGVNTLFLAFGFLSWYETPDDTAPVLSPLILLPVTLEKPALDSPWDLHPTEDDLAPNHPITELLRSQFSLALPAFDEEKLRESPEHLQAYLAQVQQAIASHDRWSILPTAGLGTFAFQKVSMWQDLSTNEDQVTSHTVCRALAGDAAPMRAQAAPAPQGALDDRAPLNAAHIILDCDSSQHEAIQLVKQGRNLVLDGPPGTGKSQTIANIIAQSLADGKTVLFVSEKAAALEVVKRRLDAKNLGSFCLECHSHKANKRSIVQDLQRALTAQHESYPPLTDELATLQKSRDTLTLYVKALHAPRSALGISAYQAHGLYVQAKHAPATRQAMVNTHTIQPQQLRDVRSAIESLVACQATIESRETHPWRNATVMAPPLSLPDDIRHHFSAAASALIDAQPSLTVFISEGFFPQEATLPQIPPAVDEVTKTSSYPFIPAHWLKLGLPPTGQKYTQLCDHSQNYAKICQSVDCFKSESLLDTDTQAFLDAAHAHETFLEVIPNLNSDIRQQISAIESKVDWFSRLLHNLDQAGTLTTQKLHKHLALTPLAPVTLQSTLAFAQAIQTLLPLRPINPQWFTSQGIARLAKGVHDATEVAALADALRAQLQDQSGLLPIAFSRAAIPQINAALRHGSFFSRLSGSWRRARLALSPFYKSGPPFWSSTIFDHMFQVAQWHAYQVQIQTILAPDSDFFQTQPGHAPDLQRAAHAVKSLQILAAHYGPLDSLAAALAAASPSDLQSITQTVTQAHDHVQKAYGHTVASADETNFARLLGAPDPLQVPVQDFLTKAREFSEALSKQSLRLSAIAQNLGPDSSTKPDVTALTAHAASIQELRNLRSQAESLARELSVPLPDTSQTHLGDWHTQANLAKWLTDFAATHNGQIPDRFIRPLTDPVVRESLVVAARTLTDIQSSRLQKPLAFIATLFPLDTPVSTGITINAAPIPDLIAWLQALVADADRVFEWSRFLLACDQAQKQNLTTLRDEILSGVIPVPMALASFDRAFYLAWLQTTYTADPTLGGFDLSSHNSHLAIYKRLDKFWVHNAFTRVREKVLSQSVRVSDLGAVAPESSEVGILLREANKKRRHLPLRRLFAAIPRLLLRIKPCIMMSPLSVSTYLDSPDLRFDIVIFDEASQVRPHDAVCSVYRGSQLIVAGDQKQLPPTDFFEKTTDDSGSDDDDDEAHTTSDFESILDVCAALPITRQRLKWHYRSKRESLIAFSNKHFYDDQLVTFPSCQDVHGSSGVTLVYTPDGRWSGQSAQGGINAVESLAIAQAVIKHAQENPSQSLGVITMNQAQQLRILEEIDTLRKTLPPSAPLDPGHGTHDAGRHFFSPDHPEPFFVKNLENVQGDERDVIFFGVGYAKNESGSLSHNFGPLNRQGGQRRLNVAITRARQKLSLFSSILADDIDLSRTQSQGAKLLKAYLAFASPNTSDINVGRVSIPMRNPTSQSATDIPDSGPAIAPPPNPPSPGTHLFEDQVAKALESKNLSLQRHIGCSAFKIDLALTDPADPSRFVLGIECDGPSYRDAASARDRDRLREQVLQSLGWRIIRVWSTDWARDPDRQIALILQAYQSALASPNPPAPQDPPTLAPLANTLLPSAPSSPPEDFDKIDQVPQSLIIQTVLATLDQFGAMSPEDLFLTTAKKLGFARTGPRIKEALTLALDELIARQKVQPTPENKIKLL